MAIQPMGTYTARLKVSRARKRRCGMDVISFQITSFQRTNRSGYRVSYWTGYVMLSLRALVTCVGAFGPLSRVYSSGPGVRLTWSNARCADGPSPRLRGIEHQS